MAKKKTSSQTTGAKSLRERAEGLLRANPSDVPTADVQALIHELNVHQMELEIQNEELRQAQLELAHSRDRYADLYDFAPVGHVTLNRDGHILEANLAAATLLGVERKNLVGASISTWLDHDAQDAFYLHRRAVLASNTKQSCEVNMHKVDGTPLVVHLDSIAFATDHEPQWRTAMIDVTTVSDAQQQLMESDRRYRRLTEAVTDYVYHVRVDHGRVVETTHGANCEAVTGYTPEELLANPLLWIAMVPTEDRAIVEQQATRILCGDDSSPIEHRIQRKDGKTIWVLNTVSPQRDVRGQLIAYDGLVRDITERKEADDTVRQLNETLEQRVSERTHEVRLLAEAMANLGEGVMITTDHLDWPGPQIVYANEAMCRITGYTTEELVGQTPRILQGEMTDKKAIRRLQGELSKKRPGCCEVINYHKDGTPYTAEFFITPLYDAAGNHTNFIAIHRDISERKRQDQQLRERAERIRAILNTAADAIITIDQRGIIDSFNPATMLMFGYAEEELIGRNVNILMPSPYREEHDGYIARYLKTGEATIIGNGREVVGRRKDGSTFPLDLVVSEVGHFGLFTGIIRDISDRKGAEESLRREHELSESMIELPQNIVLILNTDGSIVRFNRYLEELTGWQLDEVKGRDWFETFLPHRLRQQTRAVFAQALHGGRTKGNIDSIITRDGRELEIEWYDSPLTDIDGNLVGVLCTGQDVTERRLLEHEILEIAAKEQRRIGQELHDGTQQQLTGLGLFAQNVVAALDKLCQADEESRLLREVGLLDRIVALSQRARQVQIGLEQTAREVNQLARGLIPVELDDQGLKSSLIELARAVSDVQQVECTFSCESTMEVRDNTVATHLYRIAQEAVNNALKHSQGDHITIQLSELNDKITLKVLDNGTGIVEKDPNGTGMGLPIMAYRADLIGATLTVGPANVGGTEVICTVIPR